MLVIRKHPHDHDMVEIYRPKSKSDTFVLWGVVHMDIFYQDKRTYKRLADGEEIVIKIEEVNNADE